MSYGPAQPYGSVPPYSASPTSAQPAATPAPAAVAAAADASAAAYDAQLETYYLHYLSLGASIPPPASAAQAAAYARAAARLAQQRARAQQYQLPRHAHHHQQPHAYWQQPGAPFPHPQHSYAQPEPPVSMPASTSSSAYAYATLPRSAALPPQPQTAPGGDYDSSLQRHRAPSRAAARPLPSFPRQQHPRSPQARSLSAGESDGLASTLGTMSLGRGSGPNAPVKREDHQLSTCSACRKPIFGRAVHTSSGTMSRTWHTECFVCAEPSCGEPLEFVAHAEAPEDYCESSSDEEGEGGGARRRVEPGTPFCALHHEALFSHVCAQCRTPIAANSLLQIDDPRIVRRVRETDERLRKDHKRKLAALNAAAESKRREKKSGMDKPARYDAQADSSSDDEGGAGVPVIVCEPDSSDEEEERVEFEDPGSRPRRVATRLHAYFHLDHFFCASCGDTFVPPQAHTTTTTAPLTDVHALMSPYLVRKDGYAYCGKCATRLDGPESHTCARCTRQIVADEEQVDVAAGDAVLRYHAQCFVCAHCERLLEEEYCVYEKDGVEETLCGGCFDLAARRDAALAT